MSDDFVSPGEGLPRLASGLPGEGPGSILGLMTKYWIAGRVKTRLGSSIGMQRAARVHRLFVTHLVQTLADAADSRQIVLWPSDRGDDLAQQLQANWLVGQQADGDLGARMGGWFRAVLEHSGRRKAVLIGADCPLIESDDIRQAESLLEDHDVVLGPAADGGYYLVAMRTPHPLRSPPPTCSPTERSSQLQVRLAAMFRDMPWSTDQVFAETRRRVRAGGWSLAVLPVRSDIDTVADLRNLLSELRRGVAEPALAPSSAEQEPGHAEGQGIGPRQDGRRLLEGLHKIFGDRIDHILESR